MHGGGNGDLMFSLNILFRATSHAVRMLNLMVVSSTTAHRTTYCCLRLLRPHLPGTEPGNTKTYLPASSNKALTPIMDRTLLKSLCHMPFGTTSVENIIRQQLSGVRIALFCGQPAGLLNARLMFYLLRRLQTSRH